MKTQEQQSPQNPDMQYEINILQCIVTYPAIFAPQLTDTAIRKAIIYMLELYILEKKISLSELSTIAQTIRLFMGLGRNGLGDILTKIHSLSDEPLRNKQAIYDNVLTILQELKQEIKNDLRLCN